MKKGEYEIENDKIKKAPIVFAGTMVQVRRIDIEFRFSFWISLFIFIRTTVQVRRSVKFNICTLSFTL